MAYAAVVSTVEILQQITQHDDRYSLLFPDKELTESLLDKFSTLQLFLEGGEEANSCPRGRIRDAAYWTQDIIESHVSNVSFLDKQTLQCCHRVRHESWISSVQKVMSLRRKRVDSRGDRLEKLHQDLRNVGQEVDSVLEEAMRIVWSQAVEDLPSGDCSGHSGSRRTKPSWGMTSMVGVDKDLADIKDRLWGGSSSNLQVVPIVGMAGIGKTTLANNVFYDPAIACHFDLRAWATVTQKHKLQHILLDLINSMSASNSNLYLFELIKSMSASGEYLCWGKEGQLAEGLYKSLKGRRYLIVLDDIWNTEAWDEVKQLFPDDDNGSRIILTTRLVDVALYANPFGLFHEMPFLDENQSWNLLRDKVFSEEHCPPELEEVGKLIAKNCRGLPLVIVSIAGVLSETSRIEYQWDNIARGVSSALATNDEQFSLKILSLSYNHLPIHLKPCFLYIGGFPEDHEIPVFELITLWMAEGFLKPVGSKMLEEVAEEYLDDLVRRRLVIVTKRRLNGKFRFCRIHDLVRDLCIKIAREEKFLHAMDGIQEFIENKRRLSFSKSVEWFHFRHAEPVHSIARTVFCSVYTEWLEGFCLLRVLDVLQVFLDAFPVEVLKLFHLRYLAFRSGFIYHCTLPPSMADHQNLQTLIISSSVNFGETNPIKAAHLPIWKMPKLRHLVFLNITLWPLPYPVGIDEEYPALENLQTLSRVRNFKFTKMAVDMILNLKKLKAVYTCEASKRISEYNLHNLVHLQELVTLNLNFCVTSINPVDLGLPVKLKKLTLSGSGLPWKDMTMIGSLPNLEVLKLLSLSVVGEEWEPVEGELLQLKFLLMEGLDLKRWMAESSHFPRLEHLIIRHCVELESIPFEIGEIPTLEVVELDDVSPSAAESAVTILEEDRSLGNNVLRVRVGCEWK